MVLSSAPEARRPSGSTASALTQAVWPSSRAVSCAGVRVPEPDGAVVSARGEAAVRQDGERADPSRMAFEPRRLLAGVRVPEPDGVVVRARGEAAVRQHGERADPSRMAFEPRRLLAGVRVPEPDGVVVSARGEAAVRQHGERADRAVWPSSRAVSWPVFASQSRMVLSPEPEARRPSGRTASALTRGRMAFEPRRLLAGVRVPEPDGAVVRARGEAAVRQDGERADRSRMAFEPRRLLAGVRVPEPDGVVVRARGEAAVRAARRAR